MAKMGQLKYSRQMNIILKDLFDLLGMPLNRTSACPTGDGRRIFLVRVDLTTLLMPIESSLQTDGDAGTGPAILVFYNGHPGIYTPKRNKYSGSVEHVPYI